MALGHGQGRGRGAGAGAIGREMTRPGEEDGQADPHPDRSEAEGDVPAIGLPQKAADDRGDERAEVDPGEIELEARVAARVTVAVQIANLADEVAAQAPRARDQQRKRGEERRVEPHREMPGRHQPRAEGDRSPPPDAVADHATDDRHEIHQPDVKPEDLARQRGHR